LRTHSEHYLLIGAQERVARRYGARAPRRPRGPKELFWRRVFAPIYRVLPWTLRHRIMLTIAWQPSPALGTATRSRGPAVF
jgi:hypothetical protein